MGLSEFFWVPTGMWRIVKSPSITLGPICLGVSDRFYEIGSISVWCINAYNCHIFFVYCCLYEYIVSSLSILIILGLCLICQHKSDYSHLHPALAYLHIINSPSFHSTRCVFAAEEYLFETTNSWVLCFDPIDQFITFNYRI